MAGNYLHPLDQERHRSISILPAFSSSLFSFPLTIVSFSVPVSFPSASPPVLPSFISLPPHIQDHAQRVDQAWGRQLDVGWDGLQPSADEMPQA
eukprot:750437-Hanusia_phi.AAC.2